MLRNPLLSSLWIVPGIFLGACQTSEVWSETPVPQTAAEPAAGFYAEDARSSFRGLGAGEQLDLAGTAIVADPAAPPEERKMVYSASLAIEVARTDDAIERCTQSVEARGGYVSQRDGTNLTCRVPIAAYDEFLVELRAFGRVLHEAQRAEDVTRRHRDLGIRLENATEARARLLALLETATDVKDVLAIEAELRRLTDEIETMTAELRALDGRIALATVEVAFSAPASRPDAPRRPSLFPWIDALGVERVLRGF
jgi:hypothetical protein